MPGSAKSLRNASTSGADGAEVLRHQAQVGIVCRAPRRAAPGRGPLPICPPGRRSRRREFPNRRPGRGSGRCARYRSAVPPRRSAAATTRIPTVSIAAPVVLRVAPQLALGAEVVRRHARHGNRVAALRPGRTATGAPRHRRSPDAHKSAYPRTAVCRAHWRSGAVRVPLAVKHELAKTQCGQLRWTVRARAARRPRARSAAAPLASWSRAGCPRSSRKAWKRT